MSGTLSFDQFIAELQNIFSLLGISSLADIDRILGNVA